MSRLKPLSPDDVPELEEAFGTFKRRMGFIANSGLIMARRPGIVKNLAGLASAILDPENGTVSLALKSCICEVASHVTGCLYCQAHFANNAARAGVPQDKLKDVWNFEQSEHFDDAERAALRFTVAASQVPNAVTVRHFEELARHFDDGQVVEILATVCYVGFLNRWNDSLATTLEDLPAEAGQTYLRQAGWNVGKHSADG
jgi:uncharacterized peroxidase-related enzyme